MGWSQRRLAQLLGITQPGVAQRERTQCRYGVTELLALQRLSGLTPLEFWDLLKAIAKEAE
ncbi:MAG: hypothetical protein ACRC9R_08510 [Enterovibrio sp.]